MSTNTFTYRDLMDRGWTKREVARKLRGHRIESEPPYSYPADAVLAAEERRGTSTRPSEEPWTNPATAAPSYLQSTAWDAAERMQSSVATGGELEVYLYSDVMEAVIARDYQCRGCGCRRRIGGPVQWFSTSGEEQGWWSHQCGTCGSVGYPMSVVWRTDDPGSPSTAMQDLIAEDRANHVHQTQ